MKKENKNQKDSTWVDIHNDQLMREMGIIRTLPVVPRDPSVWTKTANERRILRAAKNYYRNEDSHFHTSPIKSIPVRDRLVIYLKKNKEFPKTTYSIECWQHDIPNILSKYPVAKYSYGGRTYATSELPFWNL